MSDKYPSVYDVSKVGEYPALAKAGGGYVWDEVLEYRVWCHPENGGDDYYYPFSDCGDALAFYHKTEGAEKPLALVLQKEYITEPAPGEYVHIKEERITEWPIEFLSRPKRTPSTIPNFMDPHAPENKLDILRGNA